MKMLSIESQSQSDCDENSLYRSNPRRSCIINKTECKEQEQETDDEECKEIEIENDRASDEDFSLVNKPKKRKKRKGGPKSIARKEKEKLRRKLKKKGNFAPSFEDVLRAQFQKHDQKYVYEDEEELEESDEEEPSNGADGEEIQNLKEKSPSPKQPDPIVVKKRKVIIYPWRPIGITGGRFPVNDVRALNDINPYTHSDDDDINE